MSSSSSVQSEARLGFAWWQFTGWAGLIVGTLTCLAQLDKLGGLAVILAVINICLTVAIIKYSKYAFLAATVLSLNPIFWIINGIYLKNRWNEPRLMENWRAAEEEQRYAAAAAAAAVGDPQHGSGSEAPAALATSATVTTVQVREAATSQPQKTDEDLWAEAMAEANSDGRRQGLWAKCFGEAGGVESAARAAYMAARVKEMKAEQAAEAAAAEARRLAEEEDRRLAHLSEEQRAYERLPKGNCPNCDAVIPLSSLECPKCKASFGPGSAWKVTPRA